VPDADQLRAIQARVGNWDINAYLPPETARWCHNVLASLGLDTQAMEYPAPEDIQRPYFRQYYLLQQAVSNHVCSGASPKLALCEKPVGAYSFQDSSVHQSNDEMVDPDLVFLSRT